VDWGGQGRGGLTGREKRAEGASLNVRGWVSPMGSGLGGGEGEPFRLSSRKIIRFTQSRRSPTTLFPSMPADSYNGLKAFAFIVGVTFLIFSILYVTKRYNPNLFAHEAFSQNYPWYIGRFSDPPPDRARPSVGEKPAMWDVWIASWHPSQPETSGLGTTDAEPDAGRAANEEKRLGWAEFLVSRVFAPSCRVLIDIFHPAIICRQGL